MNFSTENNQEHQFLGGDRPFSHNTGTTDYGLNPIEDEFFNDSQLDSSYNANLELEVAETETSPYSQNQEDTHQLVFIDSAVEDSQILIDNISGAAEVIVLDGDRDELVQIGEHLGEYRDLDAVHIVSHSQSGQLSFNNATLNSDTLPEYKEMLEDWSLALDSEADLLLYGCDLTSDDSGNSFVREFSAVTGADISASTDDTGIDGDWELETVVGEVETSSIFDSAVEDAYQHTLDDLVYEGEISYPIDDGVDVEVDDGALDDFDDQVNDELSGGNDDDDDDNSSSELDSEFTFTGDEFFDADFYLEQNPDIAEDGVNPQQHYVEYGWKEGRDPNAVFDTSFYLEQNIDVAEANINPLQHYYENAASDELDRYQNQTHQSFGTSDGTLYAPADLNESQFEKFKNLAQEESDLAFAATLAIPIVIVGGNTVLAVTALSIGAIIAAKSIQELIEANQPEVFVPEGDIDSSTPPFDLGEASQIDPESFPNGDDFLEGILDGQYEFPSDDGTGGAYYLTASVYDDSQGFTQDSNPDPAADRLAEKLGGRSRQIFNSDSDGREIDTISDQYVAETKEGSPQLKPRLRRQAKALFEAAQQTGREVYYEFENPPREEFVNKLNEYSERYGVNVVIDVLNP